MKRNLVFALLIALIVSSTSLAYTTAYVVEVSRESALQRYEAKSWGSAAISLEMWAEEAQNLADILFRATGPISVALVVDQQQHVFKYQELAFKYQAEANLARVMQAECYVQMRDNDRAFEVLVPAFDTITSDEFDTWVRAMAILKKILDLE